MVRLPPAALGSIPDEPGPERLPSFYWTVMRGDDALHPPTQPVTPRSRVVLLHGWLQDHTCWLTTAHRLRDTYGHDVLLMDFYGHGRSPYLANYRHMNIHTSTRQLRLLLQHVGWQHDSVVLAGLSFGGGVAQHYALRFPSHVERLLLVASVGSPEPSWRPIPIITRAFVAFTRWLLFPSEPSAPAEECLERIEHEASTEEPSTLDKLRGKLWIARKYPDHFLPDEMPEFLRRYPMTLVWGRYDTLHSPNLRRWMCKQPKSAAVASTSTSTSSAVAVAAAAASAADGVDQTNAAPRKAPRDDLNVLLFPMDHTVFCLSIDKMRLHTYPHFWHDVRHMRAATPSPPSSASPQPAVADSPLFKSRL